VEENAKLFVDNHGIALFVDLFTLTHYSSDNTIIPLQSNLLTYTKAAIEGEWFYSTVTYDEEAKEKKKTRHGPVNLEQLTELYDKLIINNETLIWSQGMEDWHELREITQLQWIICSKDVGLLTDIELALLILSSLIELVKLYPTKDKDNGIIRPLPRPKRLLSSPLYLPFITQGILTFNPQIVDRTARLLLLLIEDNFAVQPKFYLYGIYYFILLYPGSNLIPICEILKETHRNQNFKKQRHHRTFHSLSPSSSRCNQHSR